MKTGNYKIKYKKIKGEDGRVIIVEEKEIRSIPNIKSGGGVRHENINN